MCRQKGSIIRRRPFFPDLPSEPSSRVAFRRVVRVPAILNVWSPLHMLLFAVICIHLTDGFMINCTSVFALCIVIVSFV